MRLGLSEGSPLKWKNILCIPSIHSRAYFAEFVRIAFKKFRPTLVAIEQPELFTEHLREAVSRLPNVSLIVRSFNDEGRSSYIPIDPCDSMIEAVRFAVAFELPFVCVDKDVDSFKQNSPYLMPDDHLLMSMSLERYYSEIIKRYSFFNQNKDEDDIKREKYIAGKLASISESYERVLYVGGLSHWEAVKSHLDEGVLPQAESERESSVEIYNVEKQSLKNVLGELPFITYVYWLHRTGKEQEFDKLKLIQRVFFESFKKYKLDIPIPQKKGMMRYLRNLALLDKHATPDYIDILTAAKNFVNNEYAIEVMESCEYYPYYKEDERYKNIRIDKDPQTSELEAFLKDKKIKLMNRQNVWKRANKKISMKKRPAQKYDGEWNDVWKKSTNLLSHVPEDISMERYMDYVREMVINSISEDRAHIERFTISVKDGIDMRETIRNYREGKIYVREVPKVHGKVGPVVMIFDESNFDDYGWRITWLSEAHDDSDLLLYASEPGLELVGPGISRCYFGGYASIMPPKLKHELWHFYPIFQRSGITNSPHDYLLYSAVMSSEERYVAYIAPSPPSPAVKTAAAHTGVEIIYLPLKSFSSETVRKLRSFHVLGHKRLRDIAGRYIF